MDLRPFKDTQKDEYSHLAKNIMQSWQWGQFRKKMSVSIARFGLYEKNRLKKVFQLSFHKIPFTNLTVGYLPKGPSLDDELAQALKKIGEDYRCTFIKIEPDEEVSSIKYQVPREFVPSSKPLFTKYNFIVDLTKSEDELFESLHPKTRYNIKVAQRHRVKIEKRSDNEALEIYLRLYFETTKRQAFHGHNETYHRELFELFQKSQMARFLIAFYSPPPSFSEKIPLAAWMLLSFKDTLYYPYGGSSEKYKNVMASNLLAWEAIKLGKRMGLKKFDMWGALGPNPSPNDPWYGFHRFKQGYGGELVEYIGTYDLVFNWPIYWIFTFIDKLMPLKVFLLKLLGR